jgi:hypothetical protein
LVQSARCSIAAQDEIGLALKSGVTLVWGFDRQRRRVAQRDASGWMLARAAAAPEALMSIRHSSARCSRTRRTPTPRKPALIDLSFGQTAPIFHFELASQQRARVIRNPPQQLLRRLLLLGLPALLSRQWPLLDRNLRLLRRRGVEGLLHLLARRCLGFLLLRLLCGRGRLGRSQRRVRPGPPHRHSGGNHGHPPQDRRL